MRIEFDHAFLADYARLPLRLQKQVDRKLELLAANIRHPSLRVHKMEGYEGIYEASVTRKYRITFEIHPECYYLRRVGEHDKVLRNP